MVDEVATESACAEYALVGEHRQAIAVAHMGSESVIAGQAFVERDRSAIEVSHMSCEAAVAEKAILESSATVKTLPWERKVFSHEIKAAAAEDFPRTRSYQVSFGY